MAETVFTKCAWRLIPFITLLYVVGFIDRSNVGFAALTMNRDLGFSPAVYGLGAGIFFLGYVTFQIPTAMLLARLGARRVIFCVMLVWGLVSAANAFMQGAHSFYLLRFLLGVAEGGFTPSMIFYLTLWFPPAYRGRFIATFCSAIPIAGIISGPLSGLILGMDGHWRSAWLAMAVPDPGPARGAAGFCGARRPARRPGAGPLAGRGGKKRPSPRALAGDAPPPERNIGQALCDPRLILLGLAGLGSAIALYGINLWLPQIIQAMGFSNRATGFVAAHALSWSAWWRWWPGRRFSDTRGRADLAHRPHHAAGGGGADGRRPAPAIIWSSLSPFTLAMAGRSVRHRAVPEPGVVLLARPRRGGRAGAGQYHRHLWRFSRAGHRGLPQGAHAMAMARPWRRWALRSCWRH